MVTIPVAHHRRIRRTGHRPLIQETEAYERRCLQRIGLHDGLQPDVIATETPVAALTLTGILLRKRLTCTVLRYVLSVHAPAHLTLTAQVMPVSADRLSVPHIFTKINPGVD